METPPNNNRFRILHIEDNSLDAELIESALQVHLPCDITTVNTKASLEAALEGAEPDLILSDSNLPSFDGLSALDLASLKSPGTPFVFCSGQISEEKKTEALRRGAVDCIPKNDMAGLIAFVKKLCAKKQR